MTIIPHNRSLERQVNEVTQALFPLQDKNAENWSWKQMRDASGVVDRAVAHVHTIDINQTGIHTAAGVGSGDSDGAAASAAAADITETSTIRYAEEDGKQSHREQ